MERNEKVLKHVDPKGKGLEIGAGYSPSAPKSTGFDVETLDHLGREELVRKYSGHQNVDTGKIEEVDYVWNGEPYSELTGKKDYYDWVIASHLVEHTPDLIGFLLNCDEVMKDTGVISLVVPDKRYCFDHFRPITSIAAIIDSYLQGNSLHTPGRIAEYYLGVVARGGVIAWDETTRGNFEFRHTSAEALARFERARDASEYDDIHAWCFVPHSFRLIIHDLQMLGLIPFREVDFFLSQGCEFYITLGRQGKGIGISRLEMLQVIDAEIASGAR